MVKELARVRRDSQLALALPFVRLPVGDFATALERVGLTVRVLRGSGESGGVTFKYLDGRVNVAVVDGIVVGIDGIG